MAKKIKEAQEKELHVTEVRMAWEKKGWVAVYEHRNHDVYGLVIAVTMKKNNQSILFQNRKRYETRIIVETLSKRRESAGNWFYPH